MKFKSDQGHYLTKALFFEYDTDKMNAIYTLKDDNVNDGNKVYPSLRKLFVEMEDLTEYYFAEKYLSNWEHWCRIREATWLEYTKWREELEIRVKAKSLNVIQQITNDPDSKERFAASKFILQDGWKPKRTGGVGRTTNEKIKKEADKMFAGAKDINNDYDRLLSKE